MMPQAYARRICPTHMPDPDANRICTDGRTDGHTETIAHVTSKSSPTDTCAHVQDFIDYEGRIEIHNEHQGVNDEPQSLNLYAEAVTEWMSGFDPLPQRWPLERSGERELTPWALRLAVAMRDNFICRHCHIPSYPNIEIDHIVPWSAGGSDRSSNLRVLCKRCNQQRSNRRDATESWQPRPVTWWCVQCWHPGAPGRQPWRTGDDLNIGHRVTAGLVTAYCAFCKAARLTDVTL